MFYIFYDLGRIFDNKNSECRNKMIDKIVSEIGAILGGVNFSL